MKIMPNNLLREFEQYQEEFKEAPSCVPGGTYLEIAFAQFLVEDCAQSHGAAYNGQMTGT